MRKYLRIGCFCLRYIEIAFVQNKQRGRLMFVYLRNLLLRVLRDIMFVYVCTLWC